MQYDRSTKSLSATKIKLLHFINIYHFYFQFCYKNVGTISIICMFEFLYHILHMFSIKKCCFRNNTNKHLTQQKIYIKNYRNKELLSIFYSMNINKSFYYEKSAKQTNKSIKTRYLFILLNRTYSISKINHISKNSISNLDCPFIFNVKALLKKFLNTQLSLCLS